MPLPIIETPKYETRIPSTGARVQYRPYLVKEEKILMVAKETTDQKQIMQAVKDVIASCTFNQVDPSTLSVFDLEYLFLKLRSKSVGETSKIMLRCEKCDKPNPQEINLEAISIDTSKLPSPKIMLTDKIGIVMNWPRVDLIGEIASGNLSPQDAVMSIITGCIDSIFDDKGVYRASEQSKQELLTFVESLNQGQFAKIQAFIEATPKLEHKLEFTCPHCSQVNSHLIRGLQSFFS